MADLIFRGVKNPANCSECFFWPICPCLADFDDYSAILDAVHDGNLVRHEECPVYPLPEGHGRLGDLDKLDYAFTALRFNEDGSLNHWDDRKNWCLHGNEIETILANAPTIVPAEGGPTMADIETDLYLAYENGYDAGKKDATQKWISVKERLPEETPAKCLCFCKDGYMVGTYTNWGWMFPCYFGPVTHWIPLPEPPTEGGADNAPTSD